jgi:hypothetical protein
MERKKKNKLCIANIDMASIIKLAQDYEDLQHECQELFLIVNELFNEGTLRKAIAFRDDYLDCTLNKIIAAFKENRITPKNLQK